MTLKRKLQVIAFVYVIEGYPMGIYVDVLQVYFARLGVSTAELGYIMGLKLAWSLKVIWSPLIDRFGLRRHWIAASNVAMGSALFCVSVLGGDHLTMGIWLAVSVYCIASATQDIAIDAYTIGFVDDGDVTDGGSTEETPPPDSSDETSSPPPLPEGFDGLVVFSVSPDEGISEMGRVSTRFEQDGFYFSSFTRGIFIGDNVFAVTDARLAIGPHAH